MKLALALLVALQPLLDRAAAYVEQYKHDFALVISDEDYTQRLSGRAASRAPRQRRTRAEMLFTWTADEQAWLTVRNVLSVDRRAVADSQVRFNELLSGSVNDRYHTTTPRPPSADSSAASASLIAGSA